jgi:hypothetical protein
VRGAAALLAALALLTAEARANPPEVNEAIPGAEQVGQARYQYMVWAVFDAVLWSDDGVFAWERPFALSLTYRRSISARALAEQTRIEMQARGAGDAQSLAPLGARLTRCFADVSAGDRITAISLGANRARLYYNGAPTCTLEWPGLQRAFFGIWLDGRDSASFSARLRGG